MIPDEEILKNLTELFEKHPAILAAYLYGSRVAGSSLRTSDLDLAVVVEGVKTVDYQILFLEANRIVVDMDIDLRVITRKTSPTFIFQVLKKGKLIYQKDVLKRVGFEARALVEYYDTQHVRDIYDSYLRKAFR